MQSTSSADLTRAMSKTSQQLSITPQQSNAAQLRISREEEHLNVLESESSGEAYEPFDEPTAANPSEATERHLRAPLWLRLLGVLPWASESACWRWTCGGYSLAVILVAVLAVGASAVHFQMARHAEGGKQLPFEQLCDLALAVGSLLGLIAQRVLLGCRLLGASRALLVTFARRQSRSVLSKWRRISRRLSWLLAFFWLCSVVLRCVGASRRHPEGFSWLEAGGLAAFAFTSAAFTGLTYGVLHMSCAIALIVDAYCVQCWTGWDVTERVNEWNRITSLLRMVSRKAEKTFLILQTTALAMLFLCASDVVFNGGGSPFWLSATVVLTLGVLLTFFKAADVTEVCARVPAFINSLTSDDAVDDERHYLVQYVMYSAAGFYVGEARLTGAAALKLVYTFALVVFSILTKAATNN